MQTANWNKRKMSQWVNCLNFEQRKLVVEMYTGGISISAIARIYQVHNSSIRYHLKKAEVYNKNQKGGINYSNITKANTGASLDFHNSRGNKIKIIPKVMLNAIGWNNNEKNFPLSYAEYLKRDRQKHATSNS